MEQQLQQTNSKNTPNPEKKKGKPSSEKTSKYNILTGTEFDFLLGTGSLESTIEKQNSVHEKKSEPEHKKKSSTKTSKKKEKTAKETTGQDTPQNPSLNHGTGVEDTYSKNENITDTKQGDTPLPESMENTDTEPISEPLADIPPEKPKEEQIEEPIAEGDSSNHSTSEKESSVSSVPSTETTSLETDCFQSKRQLLDTIVSEDSVTLKVSPFIYYKDMTVVHTRSRDCSKAILHKMIQHGDFSKIHEDILKIVYSYTYLNAFLIRVRLAYLYKSEIIDATKFRSLLRSMVKNGLLVQHECSYTDEKGIKRGTPFFYSVSGGGLRHVKEQRAWSFSLLRKEPIFSIKRALQILAENQFDILFERQYAKGPAMAYTDFNGSISNETSLRLLYGLRLPHNAKLELFVFSVRDDEDWLRDYRSKLKEAQSFASFHGIDNFSILVICENEWMSMAAQRYKDTDKDLNALDVFYTTDSALVNNDGVFDRLIEVKPQNNHFERNIFRWNL